MTIKYIVRCLSKEKDTPTMYLRAAGSRPRSVADMFRATLYDTLDEALAGAHYMSHYLTASAILFADPDVVACDVSNDPIPKTLILLTDAEYGVLARNDVITGEPLYRNLSPSGTDSTLVSREHAWLTRSPYKALCVVRKFGGKVVLLAANRKVEPVNEETPKEFKIAGESTLYFAAVYKGRMDGNLTYVSVKGSPSYFTLDVGEAVLHPTPEKAADDRLLFSYHGSIETTDVVAVAIHKEKWKVVKDDKIVEEERVVRWHHPEVKFIVRFPALPGSHDQFWVMDGTLGGPTTEILDATRFASAVEAGKYTKGCESLAGHIRCSLPVVEADRDTWEPDYTKHKPEQKKENAPMRYIVRVKNSNPARYLHFPQAGIEVTKDIHDASTFDTLAGALSNCASGREVVCIDEKCRVVEREFVIAVLPKGKTTHYMTSYGTLSDHESRAWRTKDAYDCNLKMMKIKGLKDAPAWMSNPDIRSCVMAVTPLNELENAMAKAFDAIEAITEVLKPAEEAQKVLKEVDDRVPEKDSPSKKKTTYYMFAPCVLNEKGWPCSWLTYKNGAYGFTAFIEQAVTRFDVLEACKLAEEYIKPGDDCIPSVLCVEIDGSKVRAIYGAEYRVMRKNDPKFKGLHQYRTTIGWSSIYADAKVFNNVALAYDEAKNTVPAEGYLPASIVASVPLSAIASAPLSTLGKEEEKTGPTPVIEPKPIFSAKEMKGSGLRYVLCQRPDEAEMSKRGVKPGGDFVPCYANMPTRGGLGYTANLERATAWNTIEQAMVYYAAFGHYECYQKPEIVPVLEHDGKLVEYTHKHCYVILRPGGDGYCAMYLANKNDWIRDCEKADRWESPIEAFQEADKWEDAHVQLMCVFVGGLPMPPNPDDSVGGPYHVPATMLEKAIASQVKAEMEAPAQMGTATPAAAEATKEAFDVEAGMKELAKIKAEKSMTECLIEAQAEPLPPDSMQAGCKEAIAAGYVIPFRLIAKGSLDVSKVRFTMKNKKTGKFLWFTTRGELSTSDNLCGADFYPTIDKLIDAVRGKWPTYGGPNGITRPEAFDWVVLPVLNADTDDPGSFICKYAVKVTPEKKVPWIGDLYLAADAEKGVTEEKIHVRLWDDAIDALGFAQAAMKDGAFKAEVLPVPMDFNTAIIPEGTTVSPKKEVPIYQYAIWRREAACYLRKYDHQPKGLEHAALYPSIEAARRIMCPAAEEIHTIKIEGGKREKVETRYVIVFPGSGESTRKFLITEGINAKEDKDGTKTVFNIDRAAIWENATTAYDALCNTAMRSPGRGEPRVEATIVYGDGRLSAKQLVATARKNVEEQIEAKARIAIDFAKPGSSSVAVWAIVWHGPVSDGKPLYVVASDTQVVTYTSEPTRATWWMTEEAAKTFLKHNLAVIAKVGVNAEAKVEKFILPKVAVTPEPPDENTVYAIVYYNRKGNPLFLANGKDGKMTQAEKIEDAAVWLSPSAAANFLLAHRADIPLYLMSQSEPEIVPYNVAPQAPTTKAEPIKTVYMIAQRMCGGLIFGRAIGPDDWCVDSDIARATLFISPEKAADRLANFCKTFDASCTEIVAVDVTSKPYQVLNGSWGIRLTNSHQGNAYYVQSTLDAGRKAVTGQVEKAQLWAKAIDALTETKRWGTWAKIEVLFVQDALSYEEEAAVANVLVSEAPQVVDPAEGKTGDDAMVEILADCGVTPESLKAAIAPVKDEAIDEAAKVLVEACAAAGLNPQEVLDAVAEKDRPLLEAASMQKLKKAYKEMGVEFEKAKAEAGIAIDRDVKADEPADVKPDPMVAKLEDGTIWGDAAGEVVKYLLKECGEITTGIDIEQVILRLEKLTKPDEPAPDFSKMGLRCTDFVLRLETHVDGRGREAAMRSTSTGTPIEHPHFRKHLHQVLNDVIDHAIKDQKGQASKKEGGVVLHETEPWSVPPGTEMICWVDDNGNLRSCGPFTPKERLMTVTLGDDCSTEAVKEQILAAYREKGIKYGKG